MEIIGLSGFARSGKDEAVKVLVEEFGFTRVAFADKLRQVLYQLNPAIGIENLWCDHNVGLDNTKTWNYIYVQDIVDKYGWNGYKETPYSYEIRRLLQRLGTEAGRQTLWDSIWIDAAFAGLPEDAKVVVSDARFFNEFEAIRERGGKVWRIERSGVGPANSHASEMEAIKYPYFEQTVYNDGSLEEFRDKIRVRIEK